MNVVNNNTGSHEPRKMTCLVDTVTQTFQLLDPTSRLLIRIIPSTNSTHTRRLISCIALCAVIEVGIWASGAISRKTVD